MLKQESKVGAGPGKVKMYGLVRDKNGKPKFPPGATKETIPAPLWAMLTDAEKQEIENGNNSPNG